MVRAAAGVGLTIGTADLSAVRNLLSTDLDKQKVGDAARLELAKSHGVTVTVDLSIEDSLAVLNTIGDGFGAHVVVDAAGGGSWIKHWDSERRD